jgi:hypothetical protein
MAVGLLKDASRLAMSLIAIKCPAIGEFVSTGIETDEATFALVPDIVTRSLCPACGQEHAWHKHDARLIAGVSPFRSKKPAA